MKSVLRHSRVLLSTAPLLCFNNENFKQYLEKKSFFTKSSFHVDKMTMDSCQQTEFDNVYGVVVESDNTTKRRIDSWYKQECEHEVTNFDVISLDELPIESQIKILLETPSSKFVKSEKAKKIIEYALLESDFSIGTNESIFRYASHFSDIMEKFFDKHISTRKSSLPRMKLMELIKDAYNSNEFHNGYIGMPKNIEKFIRHNPDYFHDEIKVIEAFSKHKSSKSCDEFKSVSESESEKKNIVQKLISAVL